MSPHILKHRRSEEDSDGDSELSDVEQEVNTRIGNFEWCHCGHCRAMGTSTESICCREIAEITSDRFEGHQCLTLTKEFGEICLIESVMNVTLVGYNNIKHNNRSGTFINKNLRFASYKLFIRCIHNKLGKGIRRSLPS